LRRLVGSVSFPSFQPTTRYTRPRLPSSGSLGPHFPTFSGTMLGYDYHLSISMPSALARSSIPCLFHQFVSSLARKLVNAQNFASTPGLLGHPVRLFRVVHKETSGSPKFPGFPFKLMPRSSTPVVSYTLALSYPGLLPSVKMTTSAFPSKLTVILCEDISPVHDYTNFEAQSRGLPKVLRPLASDFRYRTDPQGSLPACWLGFGWVGLAPTG
jgi:hypothetical protein